MYLSKLTMLIALPTAELFTSLHTILNTYPCPPYLRRSLFDHLHSLLHSQVLAPDNPVNSKISARLDAKDRAKVARLYATRFLTPELEGEALVEALRKANESLMEEVRTQRNDVIASEYCSFVTEWFVKGINEHLVSLHTDIHRTSRPKMPF